MTYWLSWLKVVAAILVDQDLIQCHQRVEEEKEGKNLAAEVFIFSASIDVVMT